MQVEPVTENKILKDPKTGRFVAGTSSYGRKEGSRNKLGQAFVDDLYAVWQESGIDCLRWMAQNDQSGLARLAANLLPQKVEQDISVGVQIVKLPNDADISEIEQLGDKHQKYLELKKE